MEVMKVAEKVKKTPDSRLRANHNWMKENLMRIVIQPRKTEGDEIKAAAARAGQSTQQYILDAIRARMESEKWKPLGGVIKPPTHFISRSENFANQLWKITKVVKAC